MKPGSPLVVVNSWSQLRQFTDARIALGRSGVSLPTQPQLAFQLAHAQARDAVQLALDVPQLVQDLENAGLVRVEDGLVLDSAAGDRLTYLQRPDLGRRLDDASRAVLADRMGQTQGRRHDISLVIADGLSALAIARNAVPFLAALMRQLAPENWSVAPLAIVRLGRVAVADEVGERLGARLVVLLIGERPGLSSTDSMGLYVTWMPRVGLNDADRNCISNIRPAGLGYEEASRKLHYLLREMRRREISGVNLKDETARDTDAVGDTGGAPRDSFLLGPAA
jgi:ethanolamine ammonia-lyase small subunit